LNIVLILKVGWWVELPILPPDHPPPHRIYALNGHGVGEGRSSSVLSRPR
jgi:hypothetical protein